MHTSRNLIYTLAALAVVIVLVGAYVLFQGKTGPVLPIETATGTPATGATATSSTAAQAPAGGTKPAPSVVVTQGGDLKIAFDATNLKVGGAISPITMTLPAGSDGKILVLTLKSTVSSTAKSGVLIATQVHPTSTTYKISGLTLSDMTDPSNGAKLSIVAGTYVIEAVLWDKSPFGANGTYSNANLSGNNGAGTRSASFVIGAAP